MAARTCAVDAPRRARHTAPLVRRLWPDSRAGSAEVFSSSSPACASSSAAQDRSHPAARCGRQGRVHRPCPTPSMECSGEGARACPSRRVAAASPRPCGYRLSFAPARTPSRRLQRRRRPQGSLPRAQRCVGQQSTCRAGAVHRGSQPTDSTKAECSAEKAICIAARMAQSAAYAWASPPYSSSARFSGQHRNQLRREGKKSDRRGPPTPLPLAQEGQRVPHQAISIFFQS